MKNLFISFFASCALGVSALMMSTALHTPLAFSQSAEEFGVVINLSGKQRMLTQKMSKEVMLIALDENKSENLKNSDSCSSI